MTAIAPEPFTPSEAAKLLAAMPLMLGAEIEALPDGIARWRPGPDEWSVAEVLGHLIEAEERGFAGRVRTMLGGTLPDFATWDPAAVARDRADAARDPGSLLRQFAAHRAESVALVAALSADDLQRTGQHPEVGDLSVADLLHEWVHHDRNHLKQLLTIGQAATWPHMGNARRFSRPDAEAPACQD